MKKFAILLMFLSCGAFNTISAQAVLNWSLNTPDGGASLKIKINGVLVVNVQQAQYAVPQSGSIQIANNSLIEYEAQTFGAQLICAATETGLVQGYLDSIFDFWRTYGYPPDPLTSYEADSWTAYDDFDYTIQLSTIQYSN